MDKITPEETLDPLNWEEVSAIGHQMMDEMIDHLKNIRGKNVWTPTTEEVRKKFQQKMPEKGMPLNQIYQEFKNVILPYNIGNIHPRFWGWVKGNGTITGALADMLASSMNPSPSFGDHADVYVEQQIIQWVIELFNLPVQSSGLLTTGGSIANMIALTVGRNYHQKQVKTNGMTSLEKRLVIYASTETHSCMDKAVELIGIGSNYYRKISVDQDFKIKIPDLISSIEADKQAGLQPFCIIGNAGTVNTGAIDDLKALSEIAKKENMWFHVDGAFGVVPKILPEFKEVLKPIEEADSLAFDFHKWFYVNYDAGCFLIRDKEIHAQAFGVKANYLLAHERGIPSGPFNPHQMGFELSRGFRSLKIWMMFKENGLLKYQKLIRQNLRQAQFLKSLIEQNPPLELLAPVSLNIVCFRYNILGWSQNKLNMLNKEILMSLHESGKAAPSYTLVNGNYAIRAAITNHRSQNEDFEFLVKEIILLGDKLKEERNHSKM